MFPIAQKDIAATISQSSPDGESSQKTNSPATWSQMQITQLPREAISHIFDCLGCDDIAQVRNTCKLFREVVHQDHAETFFFSRLPERFRKVYQQSRSWQKRMILNNQHPFSTRLPTKEERCLNAEQHAALLCSHTLRKMMTTPRYLPEKLYSSACATNGLRMDCTMNQQFPLN